MPRYPSLYQVNTRVWLQQLSAEMGRPATLDDVSDAELDQWAKLGFDWIWLLSVWQTGERSRRVSRSQPDWRHEFQTTLPDLREDDIAGSGFAIADYRVSEDLGGETGLARFRQRLAQRGLKLMLDFVPNHMGLDHPWLDEYPDYFVNGSDYELAREPHNYRLLDTEHGEKIFAYGRDPYFAGWPDTVQLDYSNPATQAAMRGELQRIARQCDGVRCDMAMLVLPDVFQRTWGRAAPEFWPITIRQIREQQPGFVFMAEVYWDLEWTLQQLGFDYTYDKRLYDRLRDDAAKPVHDHLLAGLDFQDRLARFLENHDEPRAAATFSWERHQAAAAITFLAPGLRFFHQGQFDGRRVRISPHLVRAPDERVQPAIGEFYERLLAVLRRPTVRNGAWQLLECQTAWEGNESHHAFICYAWSLPNAPTLVVSVNFAPHASQCRVRLPGQGWSGRSWSVRDIASNATWDWSGDELTERGLYVAHEPWQVQIFELS